MAFQARRIYSDEFRQGVVDKVTQGGRTLRSVAQEAGVNEGIVRRWVIKAKRQGSTKPPKRYFTDEFKRKMVEEYLKQGGHGAAQFAAERGFSDASIRTWTADAAYNPRQKPEVPINPAPHGPTNGTGQVIDIERLIGRLILELLKFNPKIIEDVLTMRSV